ncbi:MULTISPECIES: E2 domain-containing protein [Brevundimonas]|uniref:E2 domain-containing protein n=1 Tax=Brevundimonas sp. 357 TaxID=2555782 RepID=UPI000F766CA0|nr:MULTISPECIES: E2 domain-containing protein [Brevundimonas]RSB46317.1 hypothetical protein EGK63_07485 [Brevundimonas sp. 357]
MIAPIDLLVATAPDWFTVRDRTVNQIRGEAAHGPWAGSPLDLTILSAPCPIVRETKPGTRFPAFCPDRHIQGDRTFCVGLGRGPIDSLRRARAWWADLDQYLACQAIAEATRLWPPQNALDHGPAGLYHQRALRVAERLGIMDAYLDAYFDQPSWITSTGLTKLGERRVRLTGPVVARAPQMKGDRKARLLLLELVMAERKRRAALADYKKRISNGTQTCCGAMRDCGFPKADALAA